MLLGFPWLSLVYLGLLCFPLCSFVSLGTPLFSVVFIGCPLFSFVSFGFQVFALVFLCFGSGVPCVFSLSNLQDFLWPFFGLRYLSVFAYVIPLIYYTILYDTIRYYTIPYDTIHIYLYIYILYVYIYIYIHIYIV